MASQVWKKNSCSNVFVKEVSIDGFVQAKSTTGTDFAFVINISWSDGRNRFIKRTYNDFLSLQSNVLKNHASDLRRIGANALIYLPGKPLFRRNTNELAESREPLLHRYSNRLISLPPCISRGQPVISFFESRPSDPRPSGSTNNSNSQADPYSPTAQGVHRNGHGRTLQLLPAESEDFYFDMDITQFMLSEDIAGQSELMSPRSEGGSCLGARTESSLSQDLQSLSSVLKRAGSEPVLCKEMLEVDDMSLSAVAAFNDHDEAEDDLPPMPTAEAKGSPVQASHRNHSSSTQPHTEQPQSKISSQKSSFHRSMSLLADYQAKLACVAEGQRLKPLTSLGTQRPSDEVVESDHEEDEGIETGFSAEERGSMESPDPDLDSDTNDHIEALTICSYATQIPADTEQTLEQEINAIKDEVTQEIVTTFTKEILQNIDTESNSNPRTSTSAKINSANTSSTELISDLNRNLATLRADSRNCASNDSGVGADILDNLIQ